MVELKDYFILLLSAGTGSRMGLMGKKLPKSLILIKKQTILSYIINVLKKRGAKEVNIILGYKYKKILKELKLLNIKTNYLVIKDFINTGSVYSLYKSYNLFKKNKKKKILMLHTDLIFNPKFLDNIIKSKKNNIIGIRTVDKNLYKQNSFLIEADKKFRLKKIGKLNEILKPKGEIICINKFSKKMFISLIAFLKNYFQKVTKNITWEYPISNFSKKNSLFVLKNQNYEWFNINKPSDLTLAKRTIKL